MSAHLIVFADESKSSDANCLPQTDAMYRKIIPGIWIAEEELTMLGATYLEKSYFFKNGTFTGYFIDKQSPETILMTLKGKWKVENGKIYEFDVKIEPKEFAINLPDKTIDELQCANENYFQSKADDGVILKYHRVKS